MTTSKKYIPTIGVECHVQLKTKTKLFAAVNNDARGADPNRLTSPLCFGMPGALPVLNKEAIKLAVRAGVALNAKINLRSKFDRKHYFYPDLPLGYQITQYDEPIVGAGEVVFPLDGQPVRVKINRAHLEADAGKSIHPPGKDYTLVDLNRAGTPLLEIVSEPDIHSAEAARAYAQELYLLMKYADVSDVDLYHGNMRFDVNVSISRSTDTLGTRTEVKNLNSFRSVEKAVAYEIARQEKLLSRGMQVKQETRGWDDAKMKTMTQRSKEEAHDYRYFPDPDLPPVELTSSYVDDIRIHMPPLPQVIRDQLKDSGINESQIGVILHNSHFSAIMMQAVQDRNGQRTRRIANWLTSDAQALLEDGQEFSVTYGQLCTLSDMVESSKLHSSAAKQVLSELIKKGGSVESIARNNNLLQISDDTALEKMVDQVISEQLQACQDIRRGEEKAYGFLVGQVMKLSQGQANPVIVRALLESKFKKEDSSEKS